MSSAVRLGWCIEVRNSPTLLRILPLSLNNAVYDTISARGIHEKLLGMIFFISARIVKWKTDTPFSDTFFLTFCHLFLWLSFYSGQIVLRLPADYKKRGNLIPLIFLYQTRGENRNLTPSGTTERVKKVVDIACTLCYHYKHEKHIDSQGAGRCTWSFQDTLH